MTAVVSILKHKLAQFILILLFAFLVFQFGIPILSQVMTGVAAPIPAHMLWAIFMPIIVFVMLVFVSASEASWNEFKAPLLTLVIENEKRSVIILRLLILIVVPIRAGGWTFLRVQPGVSAPPELRSIHPADPGHITVQGEQFTLQGLNSPIRGEHDKSVSAADLEAGRAVYIQNCVFCHGDALDGNGLFADGLRPRPANFRDPGAIAQLSESYVFWRVAKGGPGSLIFTMKLGISLRKGGLNETFYSNW